MFIHGLLNPIAAAAAAAAACCCLLLACLLLLLLLLLLPPHVVHLRAKQRKSQPPNIFDSKDKPFFIYTSQNVTTRYS
jgi:hypothetical protein